MKISVQTILIAAAALSLSACMGTSISRSQELTDTGYDHLTQKDYVGAKPYFERALEIEPNLAMAHLDLGAVYQNTGDRPAAREQYRLAIENDKESNNYPRVTRTTDGSQTTVTDMAKANLAKMH